MKHHAPHFTELDRLKKLRELYWRYACGDRFIDPEVIPVRTSHPNHTSPSLEALAAEVSQCHLCALSKGRRHVVFGEGNPNARIMFIGEAPGESEEREGRPFCGRSGAMLTNMIEKVLGLGRHEVYIANILKCRPPLNRTPSEEEAHLCRPYLFTQIDIIAPELIMTLGGTGFRYLTDNNTPITRARGRVWEYRGIKVIPTYHPSYLLRNPSAKKETLQDLLLLKSLLAEAT